MNIDQIKGKNYTLKKADKSESALKLNRPGSDSGLSETMSGKTNKATNLSLSGSKFENEVAFTKKLLGNSRQESLGSLKKIKQKINSGAYNNEAVHQKISSLITHDLTSLHDISFLSSGEDQAAQPISDDHKKRLLENPEVSRQVADKIAAVLKEL